MATQQACVYCGLCPIQIADKDPQPLGQKIKSSSQNAPTHLNGKEALAVVKG
jgi:hypothetical protein